MAGRVPAFTNAMGFHSRGFDTFHHETHYSGEYDEYRHDLFPIHIDTDSCSKIRGSSSSTWPVDVPGWKYPSEYRRDIMKVSPQQGSWLQFWPVLWPPGKPNNYLRIQRWVYEPIPPWAFSNDAFDGNSIVWEDDLAYESQANADANIKGKRVSLGEDLGESVKTWKALYDLGHGLVSAVRAVKHGNVKAAVDIIKDPRGIVKSGANAVLQFKYGWAPLASDIAGAAKLLQDGIRQNKQLIHAKGHARESVTIFPHPDPAYSRTGSADRGSMTTLTGEVTEHLSGLADTLGLSNPLSLGWEFIPWSFVLDWFIPVGSTLDSWTDPLGLEFVGGSTTLFGGYDLDLTITPGKDFAVETPCTTKFQCYSMKRRWLGGFPHPGFYTKSPFSSAHGTSALALLIQKTL